jgi:spore coat protein U-like protein
VNRILLGLAAAAIAQAAQAAPPQMACRLGVGGALAFGSYDIFNTAPTDTLLNISVTCERDGGPQHVVLLMRIGSGIHGTSATNRRMAHTGGSGDFLGYGLFRDVSRSSVWGATDGVDTLSQAISVPNKSSATANFTIYGRIAAQQDVSAGGYSDNVMITVMY